MTNFFKTGINFIRRNPGMLYSLGLIILIPSVLFYNTFYSVKSFQKNIDLTLQTDTLIAESIFENFASDVISNPEILQEKINQISKENPEISQLRVAVPQERDKFRITASKKPEEIGAEIKGDPIPLAWHKNQAIAYLTSNKEERFWEVVKPIHDSSGNKVGIIGLAMSLKHTDELMKEAIFRGYIVMAVAILFTLLLTIHHAMLFGYVALSKRLQEIDKMKDEFIRMATHELQSPIVNIRNYLLALEEEIRPSLTEDQKKYFSRVKISSKNLSDLVYDILEVSRIEQGRLDFTPQQFFPGKLMEEIVEEFRPKAEQKNLKLIFEPWKEVCLVKINPNRFRQILTNLIENAIKYTLTGEIKISLKLDEVKKECLVFVEDTGLGISAQNQKRLFEKFYRVKTKETADIPGTGLGLWITKELCEKMGGEIFVESIKGVGSKFTISFPLSKV